MSSVTYKPSNASVSIMIPARRRWSQRELDGLAWQVCNAWLFPDIGNGRSTDPRNSRLFALVADALGKVNGD